MPYGTEKQFLEILKKSNRIGFDSFKLEKDFYLTIALSKIGEVHPELAFKGGTCLNKVYFEYYRLSEDLDFALDYTSGRGGREKLLAGYKSSMAEIFSGLGMTISKERSSFREHSLGMYEFFYVSIIDRSTQSVKVDISIQEIMLRPKRMEIRSIFVDPLGGGMLFPRREISVMALDEVVAEKVRAAMTRKEPAIRDFYDLHHIRTNSRVDFDSLAGLIRKKLQTGGMPVSFLSNKDILKSSIRNELLPVLANGKGFDFEASFRFVSDIHWNICRMKE